MKLKKTATFPVTMSLLLALLVSCAQQTNTTETPADSLANTPDSAANISKFVNGSEAVVDPNVYQIPPHYPWLVKLVGRRFAWDSISECSRITRYDQIFNEAEVTKEQVGDLLTAAYNYKGSSITISKLNFEEMQDCGDAVCRVVLTSNWVPIGLGLKIGMNKSEFLDALGFEQNAKQNIFKYDYKVDEYTTILVAFEFENDALSLFSYEISPCHTYSIRVPPEPFFTKFFNKPFPSMKPDSVERLITSKIDIAAQRQSGRIEIEKIAESDTQPEFSFDSSVVKFNKWPAWEITYADLRSPNLTFINGIKVGMSRAAFLKTLCEEEFEGDEFRKWNQYCDDGFESVNDFRVFFKNGVVRQIVYERAACR